MVISVMVSSAASRPQIDPYWCDWSCMWAMQKRHLQFILLPYKEFHRDNTRGWWKRHLDTFEKAKHSEYRDMKFEDWKYEAETMSFGGDFEMIIGTPNTLYEWTYTTSRKDDD